MFITTTQNDKAGFISSSPVKPLCICHLVGVLFLYIDTHLSVRGVTLIGFIVFSIFNLLCVSRQGRQGLSDLK